MADETNEDRVYAELLHPSEEVHRVVLGAISDAVFIVDDEGRFTFICPNVENIFGFSFEEVVAMRTIGALLGGNLPSTRELPAGAEVTNQEMEVTDRQGARHTLLVNVKRVAVEHGTLLYTCRDITDRKRMEREFAERNERLFEEVVQGRNQLRDLARREVAAQERERARIARELHDDAGQYLTALQILVKVARDCLPVEADGGVGDKLDEAIRMTDSVTERIRGIAQGLRPPALDTLGIRAALAGLCRSVSRQSELPVDYDGESVPELGEDAVITLYRVLQEALTNAVKHADAARIGVRFYRQGGAVCLSVEDDGAGFDPDEASTDGGGLGLAGMRERIDFLGGALEIESSLGRGTRLTARVPI